MTHELALLAALFKPHMHCTWTAPGESLVFTSDNVATPSGTLLYQRNYARGFDEIIVYAYDAKKRRYVRTQLSNDGAVATAASSGPVKGTWSFPSLGGGRNADIIEWKRSAGVSRYWYVGVPGTGVCR